MLELCTLVIVVIIEFRSFNPICQCIYNFRENEWLGELVVLKLIWLKYAAKDVYLSHNIHKKSSRSSK